MFVELFYRGEKREKMGINKIKVINRNKWKEYSLLIFL